MPDTLGVSGKHKVHREPDQRYLPNQPQLGMKFQIEVSIMDDIIREIDQMLCRQPACAPGD